MNPEVGHLVLPDRFIFTFLSLKNKEVSPGFIHEGIPLSQCSAICANPRPYSSQRSGLVGNKASPAFPEGSNMPSTLRRLELEILKQKEILPGCKGELITQPVLPPVA